MVSRENSKGQLLSDKDHSHIIDEIEFSPHTIPNSSPLSSHRSSQNSIKENVGINRRMSTHARANAASQAFSSLVPCHVQEKKQVYFCIDMDITKINVVEQLFNMVGWLNFWWIDTDLPQRQDDINQPDWFIEDDGKCLPIDPQVKLFDNGNNLSLISTPKFDYNYDNCCVAWRLNFSVDISESFELYRFPFDRQFLTILLNIRTTFWHILHQAPSWVPDRYNSHRLCFYRLAAGCTGWQPHTPLVDLDHIFPSKPRVILRIERESNYYLYSIIFPLFLIVALSASSLAIDANGGLDGRLETTLTLLLTIVAFKFVITADLPKTSYLTLLDAYVMLSYLTIAFVSVENCFVCAFYRDDYAETIWYIDIIFCICFLSIWVILHILIIFGTYFHWFRISWEHLDAFQKVLFFDRKFVETKDIKPVNLIHKTNATHNLKISKIPIITPEKPEPITVKPEIVPSLNLKKNVISVQDTKTSKMPKVSPRFQPQIPIESTVVKKISVQKTQII